MEAGVRAEEGSAAPVQGTSSRWTSVWKGAGALLLVAIAAGAIAHVLVKHRRARDARIEIARLQAGLDALVPKGRSDVHATLNGVLSHLTFTQAPQGVDAAASAVAASCGNDTETGGGGGLANGDGPRHDFVRDLVRRDDSPGGSASAVLCMFRSRETGERFERFSFVRGDKTASSVTSVTRKSKADLATMFPIEGDAPGDDLAGVPRPLGSRRVVAATVVETGHAVRMYEMPRKFADQEELGRRRDAFDEQMRAAGYVPSAKVDQVLDDVRLYTRGSDRVVVAFEIAPEVTRVLLNRTDLL